MAPAAIASRMMRGSSVADTITTGRAGKRRRSSNRPPSPSMPGIFRSSSSRSRSGMAAARR